MVKFLALALGGIAGTAARYGVAAGVYRLFGAGFPYGTLAVNASGCFLIGLLESMAEVRFLIGPAGRLLLMTGFCGAYTTFSALILETSHLLRDGEATRAFLNFMGNGALGFALFRAGLYLGTRF